MHPAKSNFKIIHTIIYHHPTLIISIIILYYHHHHPFIYLLLFHSLKAPTLHSQSYVFKVQLLA